MGRIIITAILVVVLAVIVSLNLGFTTSVNVFGTRIDNVSVVAVAALSFALGIVYSLFIYLGRFLHRRAKRGLADRNRDLAERERGMVNMQAGADRAPDASFPADAPRTAPQIDGRSEAAGNPKNAEVDNRSAFAKFLDSFGLRR